MCRRRWFASGRQTFTSTARLSRDCSVAGLDEWHQQSVPIYRDDDRYALDPHDDEVRFWLFRLGFVPPRAAPLQAARPSAEPLPDPNQSLTKAGLDEAWREGVPASWSAQRVAIAVLDVHDAPMSYADVVAFVAARSQWSSLREDSSRFWRRGAIIIRPDGLWELDRGHDAVRSARQAVRDRIGDLRRWAAIRPDPAALKAHQARIERERAEHGQQLARLRRVLLQAFPASSPQALVLIDVEARAIATYVGDEMLQAIARLALEGLGVRSVPELPAEEPECSFLDHARMGVSRLDRASAADAGTCAVHKLSPVLENLSPKTARRTPLNRVTWRCVPRSTYRCRRVFRS